MAHNFRQTEILEIARNEGRVLVEALAERFKLGETLAADGSWQLVLTPDEAGLRQVFRRITLSGDRFVRAVEIEEAGGDVTTLRFLALTDEPAAASADEVARFD